MRNMSKLDFILIFELPTSFVVLPNMLQTIKKKYPYFPIIGMAGYLVFFAIATTKYPGGSINDIATEGYSFFHNFLCDLMLPITESGTVNAARPIAIFSHLLLSFTMISFFYILPEIFSYTNRNTRLVRGFGVLTMVIFIFMFTDYHDLIVTLTGVFGTVALVPFFMELMKYEGKSLRLLAFVCFGLSVIVFISFQTKIGFYYLPFLQKITFLFDAWWVIWVSLLVVEKKRSAPAIN